MKLFQLYYTSCPRGLAGKGFQTYSMSEGLTEQEQRQIEILGKYKPPNDLPSEPTAADILKYCPVSFTTFRLESGRFGVLQSVYTGQDYSRRDGNYFCHALVAEKGMFPFQPIKLYGSSIFQTGLTAQQTEIKETPPPLPSIYLDEVPLNGCPDYEHVVEFLEKEDRMQLFCSMHAGLLDYEKSFRKLVLIDRYQAVPYWMAALQYSLPIRQAHQATLTTYILNPEDYSGMICAVPPEGSGLELTEMTLEYQYRLFDVITRQMSKSEKGGAYLEMIEDIFPISPESIEAFQEFVGRFNYDKVNREIEHAYTLYTIINSGLAGLSESSVSNALNFALKNAEPELLGSMAASVDKITEHISGEVDPLTAETVAEFLFTIYETTNDPRHATTTYDFLLQAIHFLVFDSDQSSYENLIAMLDKIVLNHPQRMQGLMKRWLDREYLSELATSLSGAKPQHAGFFLFITIQILKSKGLDWQETLAIPGMKNLWEVALPIVVDSEPNLDMVISQAVGSVSLLSGVCVYSNRYAGSSHSRRQILMTIVIRLMESLNDTAARDFRFQLVEMGGDEMLYNVYLSLLDQVKNKMAFFENFEKYVFNSIPKFKEKYYSPAFNAFLKDLSSKQAWTECTARLDQASFMDNALVEKVIGIIESRIPIRCPSEPDYLLLREIYNIKLKRKIRPVPDITSILFLGMEMENKKEKVDDVTDLIDKKPDLNALDQKSYKYILDWYLPLLFHSKMTSANLQNIFNELMIPRYSMDLINRFFKYFDKFTKDQKSKTEFFDKLLVKLSKYKKENIHESFNVIFEFTIFALYQAGNLQLDMEARNKIIQKLVSLLREQTDKYKNVICTKISRDIDMFDKDIRILWTDIRNKILDEKPKSFLLKPIRFSRNKKQ